MSQKPTAIIIGAGVGGMATAIRLALKGFAVTVFEKNNAAGGKISSFNLNGFGFDEGPSLFTQPENIEELFTLAGVDIKDFFTYKSLPIACRYFFENGTIVNAYTDTDAFAEELRVKLHEDGHKVFAYLKESEKTYNDIASIFLNYSLHRKSVLNAPLKKALKTVKAGHLFSTLHQFNKAHFTQPETVQIFDRFATYNGSDPYQAPGMLSLIPHLEQNLGTYYPTGGMISIANALYKLARKLGVDFVFNSPVDEILHSHKKVSGVVVNKQVINADVVVSNMDVYFTYKYLLGNKLKAKKILKQERSSSALIFYWGIKKQFPALQLHNIFFSKDYKAEFSHIFKTGTIDHDPTIYINITSKMEASHAPGGKENWFVMVNVPANTGQDWNVWRTQCKKAVIAKLNRILKEDIEPLIEEEQVMDPVNIEEKTSSYMGSLYGTSSNGKMAAFLRHPNFHSSIKGLYFVGGSVHPGGGIPLCLHSAKLVSKLISDDKLNPSL